MLTTLKLTSPVVLGISAVIASRVVRADWDYTSGFRSEDYGTSKAGPWGLDNSLFNKLINDQPNATSIYPLTGADTTESPQQSSTPAAVDGWSWNIAVKADIPINSTNASVSSNIQSDVFTGTQITLQAPQGSKTEAGWQMCLIQWSVTDSYSEELREDDGTCSSVLSDSCRSDMASALSTEWAAHADYQCYCPDLTNITSCGTPPASFHQGCVAYRFNATEINNSTDASVPGVWSNGRLIAQNYGGGAVSAGNITAYNRTGSLAWPMMVAWGGTSKGSTPVSQLTCIRAANATTGSLVPGTNATDTSGGLSRFQDSDGQMLSMLKLLGILTVVWMVVM